MKKCFVELSALVNAVMVFFIADLRGAPVEFRCGAGWCPENVFVLRGSRGGCCAGAGPLLI